MARQPRTVLPGVPLHIVQRGNNRQAIFFAEEDRAVYLRCLEESAPASGCSIHAYVLMTNHVHLLVTPAEEHSPGLMIQALGRRFVKYVNQRYRRTGTLWEGRYKSALVDTGEYLLACMRYIELNPVRAGMVRDSSEYPWSSYAANARGQRSSLLVEHDEYRRLGRTGAARQAAYRAFFSHEMDADEVAKIRGATEKGEVIGNDKFRFQIERTIERRLKRLGHGGDRKSENYRKSIFQVV